jgi:hypothetical protein
MKPPRRSLAMDNRYHGRYVMSSVWAKVWDRYLTDGPASSGHTRTSRPRARKIGAAIRCN